ncbi:GtrA family protein OS=Tsukamurella paurometabola (strain ATCC 8368 / DSM / CCUG 35730 / CIP 100753 / JCM 10117 / KCTC 9821 / NBRC 16120 / NCIMB 702349/ NCTC 13040) OX=521096 GN=Tpau_4106 PE=3 SV=1 [Tsukamurella paurometabola]|uniref:GtrA family protein n=1 Tax=Tsukamurella paurometabola (strain ATCC 8368 / DSM 20162 / CCUG 35730 / CIP 100753 / JCM 10117 / KCTC 9821 / NBRC 16120 / NCIMB 702349 / NCTC 13040) TaxID=521096 RepID=D5UNI0_TSUPD|nr:GtrA family protein [Tsukamurella paurometabola]ADG80675.1 GtrA family protein [Tsukamurella paurometabola DSM 20162]SUP40529.1 GtrA-like protein [Tsukamurella paurometabola]
MTTSDAADRAQLDLKTQLIRFVLTGAFSAVVDFGITLILTMGFGASDFTAKTIGFICGTTTAYLLNRRWTFKAEPSTKRLAAVWALYVTMYGVQTGLYLGILALFPPSDDGGAGSYAIRALAFVIAQGTATVVNFIVQRTVIFRLM